MYHTIDLGRSIDLEDDDFVRAFESLTLPEPHFQHPDHVRLGFLYLQRYGLLDTLTRYRDRLKRFAAHHGAPDKYHETVTWALIFIIRERMAACATDIDWARFAASNPDLLDFRGGPFFDYYDASVLESDQARQIFVLPRGTHR